MLVDVLTVPSVRTSMRAVRTWPSAREPPEQASVAVLRTVKDQLPLACACVMAPPPPPPMPIKSVGLFSQAAVETRMARKKAIGRRCT